MTDLIGFSHLTYQSTPLQPLNRMTNDHKIALGRIFKQRQTKQIYQGVQLLNHLTGLEYAVLSFLLDHPWARLTKTEIITAA